jgi:5-methyltetrahydropteroyltriglutamate--homocysteine methyltransferase
MTSLASPVYVVTDIEVNGPTPGEHSMLAFASVALDAGGGEIDTFEAVLETLPDKTILLGVIDLEDEAVETPETVAARIRRALPHKDASQIIVAPDCGMKYLPRERAYAKLEAMVAGTEIVRGELEAKAA